MPFQTLLRASVVAASLFLVAACDDAQERAEGHYQSGLELLEADDPIKAKLEFQNALQLNQDYLEPRFEFAKLLMADGDIEGALGNFLKVVELDPNHLEGNINVGELYLIGNAPELAERYVTTAFAAAPDNIKVRGLKAVYEQRSGNTEAALELAQDVLADDPASTVAIGVIASDFMSKEQPEQALIYLDQGLATEEPDAALYMMKMAALNAVGDQGRITSHLEDMAAAFPENSELSQSLVQRYIQLGEVDKAEEVLRQLMANNPDETAYPLGLVNLLNTQRSPADAQALLEELVARGDANEGDYLRALAGFHFRAGDTDTSIATLEGYLARDDLDAQDKYNTQTQLGGVFRTIGENEKSNALAVEVLENDEENVDALKLRALHQIETDDYQGAIENLRSALNVSPRNPSVLTILAAAHERNGSKGLAQERLALAVQASNNGVAESIRYAEFLLREGRAEIADDVIDDALLANGPAIVLLAQSAAVKLALEDYAGAEDIVQQLTVEGAIDEARDVANRVRFATLNSQNRSEEAEELLERMWSQSGEESGAMTSLVQTYLQQGRTEEAESFLDNILADTPNNLQATMLRGAVHSSQSQFDEAEALFRKAIEDHPEAENGYGALVILLNAQGRQDEAREILDQGIRNSEGAVRLELAKAGQLERDLKFDEAIAIYERLYEANTGSLIFANNLASLLAEHRDDPESLARAAAVSKRLRESDQPAFLDTYGWVQYRAGDYEAAVAPLKEAAEALTNNALVQYHLGMVYKALGQTELARTQLQRALELGQTEVYPVLAEVPDLLTELDQAQ
ncbi:MAG: tetratricopeptide repeat protein [Pseudomonadota bacterium]